MVKIFAVVCFDKSLDPPWRLCADMYGDVQISSSPEDCVEFVTLAKQHYPTERFRVIELTESCEVATEGAN